MKDVQFISELLIIILMGRVCGFDQANIDFYYAKYDDPFDEDVAYEFDEDNFIATIDKTKKYLIGCEEKGQIITNYAKEFKHFYSLWGVVSLNIKRLPAQEEFIELYCKFMENVERFKNPDFIDSYSSQNGAQGLSNSYKYFNSSIGASTEEPQRIKRHQILLNTLFGVVFKDEDSTID
jgi:hypothetical protein